MHQRSWQIIIFLSGTMGILLSVYYVFQFRFLGVPLELTYLYLILALFGSIAFIFFPARKGAERNAIPWYDILFFLFILSGGFYLAYSGYEILFMSWAVNPPLHMTIISVVFCLLLIEAVRRTSSMVLVIIVIFFYLYPVIAPYLPGMFRGPKVFSLWDVSVYHMLSTSSVMGIPMQTVGLLVLGYIIFGATLQHTGGGKFFMDFSAAILGNARGGVAKVSILSSAFFGMLSGSAISNVITTGSITIPLMKKTGYPAHYAGAVEACASTGGTLMPPVMGAAAFIMATMIEVPYADVALAAFIPSLLYYVSLLVQVDGHAAREGIKGLETSELPPLWQTIKEGWFYFGSLLLLSYFLFWLRQSEVAPYYASGFLLLVCNLKKETRFTFDSFRNFVISTGRLLSELVIILAAVGFVMGSFFVTGIGATFSHEIANLAGGNVILLLLLGALASFILGMGMTIAACYIFLAITVAPALVASGLNPMAVHLFVLYWGALSYITPPVALAAMAAAPIAQASAMKIGFTATKMGSVKYIVPFFFVFSPALILQGDSMITSAFHIVTALVGVVFLGGALEAYIVGLGRVGYLTSSLFFVCGLSLMFPQELISTVGFGITALCFAVMWRLRRKEREKKHPGFVSES